MIQPSPGRKAGGFLRRPGIYQITNSQSGKTYIGSSVNVYQRLFQHKSSLNSKNHHNQHLQSSWHKYGEAAFEFNVLFYCAAKDLIFFEQRAVEVLNPSYNKALIAGTNLGTRRSPESREKMRLAKVGRRLSAEQKAALRAAWAGRKHTPEAKAKVSAAQKGRRHPPHSPETRLKMAESQRRRRESERRGP